MTCGFLEFDCALCTKRTDTYGAGTSLNIGRDERGYPRVELSKYFNTCDDYFFCLACTDALKKFHNEDQIDVGKKDDSTEG